MCIVTYIWREESIQGLLFGVLNHTLTHICNAHACVDIASRAIQISQTLIHELTNLHTHFATSHLNITRSHTHSAFYSVSVMTYNALFKCRSVWNSMVLVTDRCVPSALRGKRVCLVLLCGFIVDSQWMRHALLVSGCGGWTYVWHTHTYVWHTHTYVYEL